MRNEGKRGFTWSQEALEGLSDVPKLLRPMVRRKVEERVRSRGGDMVSLVHWQEAAVRFKSAAGGRSSQELAKMLPQQNKEGVEMVVFESCHSELARCPHALIPTSGWREAVAQWLAKEDLSERLRTRVKEDKVLFHHKLKITISGCPNGCSRPQIADLGLVGFVRPSCDERQCTICGTCAEVCPDNAISTDDVPPIFNYDLCMGCLKCRSDCPEECISFSGRGVRLTVGGKLGRHPHLGEAYAETSGPKEAMAVMKGLVEGYLAQGLAQERFSNWWLRTRAGSTLSHFSAP